MQCYKRILRIDPINIQGLHNLCVVYVERGKLAQAQHCLQHAHQLAPNEDYILRHLKIVQQRIANLKQMAGMTKQKSIAFAKYDPKDFGGRSDDADSTDGDLLGTNDGTANTNQNSISSKLSIDNNVDTIENTITKNTDKIIKETTTTHTKVLNGKHEKLHKPKQLIADQQYQQTTTKGMFDIEQPVFLEASKASTNNQDEYRTSNVGQNDINRRRHQTEQQQQHQHQHQQQQQTPITAEPISSNVNANSGATAQQSQHYHNHHYHHHENHRHPHQPMFVHDLDDPSSGMS